MSRAHKEAGVLGGAAGGDLLLCGGEHLAAFGDGHRAVVERSEEADPLGDVAVAE